MPKPSVDDKLETFVASLLTISKSRRFTEHGSGLGVYRWVGERTLAWLHQFRRVCIRDERRDDIHEAFLTLGCALICRQYLHSLC